MNKNELLTKLYEAQEHMVEAIDLLKAVADETDNRYAKAYLIDRLRIMTSEDHGFLSNDLNIDKWIADLEEEYDESCHDSLLGPPKDVQEQLTRGRDGWPVRDG